MTHFMRVDNAMRYLSQILHDNGFKGCHLYQWEKDDFKKFSFPDLLCDQKGNRLIPGDWYVIIRCVNDYLYFVNVSGDSVLTACAEVLIFAQNK